MESSLTRQYDPGSRSVKALAAPEEIVHLKENFESDFNITGQWEVESDGIVE